MGNNNYSRGFNNPEKEEEKKGPKIILDEPEKFDPTYETKFTTTQYICRKVNEFFRSSMDDFFGSTLLPNPMTGMLEMNLFFKESPSTGKVNGVEPIIGSNNYDKNDPGQRINRINARNASKTLQLTDDAKSILEDFLIKNHPNQKIDWNRYSVECSENVNQFNYGNNRYNIYIRVFNINIMAILAGIFGAKSDDGSYYDYNIIIDKVVPQQANLPRPNNFIVKLERYYNKNIEEFANTVGMSPTVGTYNIVQ